MLRPTSLALTALILAGLPVPALRAAEPATAPPVEFNRDIRPLLSDNCFACHGPDDGKRKSKLRLDRAEADKPVRGGTEVVGTSPKSSPLLGRVTADDDSLRMPPPGFGKKLTAAQIDLLRRWVAEGGHYQPHWSLLPPKQPEPPAVKDAAWAANPIDRFVLARLEHERLKPSPEADRRTLLRRLSFDLTGLPPTPADMDAFANDTSPDAYEKVVDRLLASPHYGERMALYWLDLVRFADTGGYHSDNHRDITLFRDYVITAFNANKPFDRFTAEQLAGDLLPDPTAEQKIASGYNRLLMTTEEGGAQPKEYTAKYAADRVRNVSSVWLGLTLGCCECHTHKFDPFTTTEFYQFAAFFADLQEKAVGRQEQFALPTDEQAAALKKLDAEIAPWKKTVDTQTPELDAAQAAWEEEVKKNNYKGLPKNVVDALSVEPAKRPAAKKQLVSAHFRGVTPLLEKERKELTRLETNRKAIDNEVSKTLISVSGPPRTVRVLPRGNWLDDSGEVVQPGTPASLPPLKVEGRRATRLDLARWLTADDNPLTARVFVNRLWKLTFGQGLVRSLEDFGSQGTPPTHPELLDWLATDFRTSGWDVKRAVKQIVMSRAYRMSSAAPEALARRDPYNLLLARQARYRLDAEVVRDNALSLGGLLSPKVGGPSVKPYQPAGYWAMLNFPKRDYVADKGEAQYRRGLYTYWQRTFPHPSLVAFDAPSREECTVERPRSNTPLQALVLLNDPTYVEASRAFAETVLTKGGKDTEARLAFAFRKVLTREPTTAEASLVTKLLEKHLAGYRADAKAAGEALQVGDRPVPKDLDPAELAAWTSVARVLFNLHETITRN